MVHKSSYASQHIHPWTIPLCFLFTWFSPVHLLGLFCSSDIDHVGVVHHLDIQFRGMFLSHVLGLAKNGRRENHGKTWRMTEQNMEKTYMDFNGWAKQIDGKWMVFFWGDSNSWYMNYHPSITIHSEWPWKKRILPCGWMEMEIVIFPTYIHMEMVIFPVSTCYITMKCYIHSLWKFQKHSHVGLLSHFLWSCSCVIYGWIVGMNSILHG